MRDRSRSPLRECSLSEGEQEAWLNEFARHYWLPPEGQSAPWLGGRSLKLIHFRLKILQEIEELVDLDLAQGRLALDDLLNPGLMASVRARWQRFVWLDDLARMSDVLFRGPIDSKHSEEMELRLTQAWRALRFQIPNLLDFAEATCHYRISAVKMAMMLETGRPPEAAQFDEQFQLPDARTLSCLLSLRCDKDDPEELQELYRLVCSKLQGTSCCHCHEPFHEGSSCGIFDGEQFTIPVTVPKVFVPPCGHAIHTTCLGYQIIPNGDGDCRAQCRLCRAPNAWTSIDVDPMVNAFCLLFGPHVDRRAQEMSEANELSKTAIQTLAEVCTNFSLELRGLVSPSSVWLLLMKRHKFLEPQMVSLIGEEVLRCLSMEDGEDLEVPTLVPALPCEVMSNEFLPEVPDGEEQLLSPEDFPESESSFEEPGFDPSAVMLNQLVEGCGGEDRSMHGLLPKPDG